MGKAEVDPYGQDEEQDEGGLATWPGEGGVGSRGEGERGSRL
jgi:hypothetical protein